MRRGNSLSIRLTLGAALATATACGRVIVLGDSESPICLESCGGGGQSGSGGVAGALAGASAQAGTNPLPAAGTGGSSVGPGGAANDGGVAGAAGDGPVPDCEPSNEDTRCDGLDQDCQITTDDPGCSNPCKGAYVNGSSYMSCIASRDFDQAEAACQANGMHLVKIDDALENATVLSLALDDYVWIGGSNRDNVDVYSWLDGTQFLNAGAAVGDTYQNFGTSEPAADTKLRCVQLRESTGGTWSNWQCSGMQSFVCERYTF